MKKLFMLTAAAGILFALASPTLAATRANRGVDAYASGEMNTDRSGAYVYGPAGQARASAAPYQAAPYQAEPSQLERGQSLPYADRPYGDPGRW
jgi:hypothetical protein